MLPNELLYATMMRACHATSIEQHEAYSKEIETLLDIIVRRMYSYGCIILSHDKKALKIVVSIPANSELNSDASDPAYLGHNDLNKTIYPITVEQMKSEITRYFELIGPAYAVTFETRPETWTIENYNEYMRCNSMELDALTTIQKTNKLNRVFRRSDIGPGGAYHDYRICKADSIDEVICEIHFQKGPRNVEGSRHGVIDEDLLEIVRDRMKSFQAGEFATPDNAKALEHIEIALMYLNKRKEDRAERNVLGTYNK